ncbi:MAG: hypothetical protein MUE85_23580 [Microscillaceae bacterium]|jgi:hypothetical protein|nr:hypothetical protein [Microscillaceae bacterium]
MSRQLLKKAWGVFWVLLGLGMPLNAQKLNDISWNVGYVVLNNHDTLAGKLYFARQADFVYFWGKKGFKIYHLQNLKHFAFFDQQLNLKRYFAQYATSRAKNQVFEQIVQGKFTLLKEVRKLYGYANDCYSEYFAGVNRYWVWDGKKLVVVAKFRKQIRDLARKNHLKIKPITAKNRQFGHIQWINALNQALSDSPFQISIR